MDVRLLDILRCPFCGSKLMLEQSPFLEIQGGEVLTGILSCQCCAYPIVSGMPYMRTGPTAGAAMCLLKTGQKERALFTLLNLEETKQQQFERLLGNERAMTFRKALEILSPDAEGTYLLYRFSDPTFLCSQTVLRAVGRDRRCWTRRALDLCGGTGHLTRSLCDLAGGSEVILADLDFWKIWLAKRFIAPSCQPVCCDANAPLPFAKDTFSLVFCSDAFHYIWSRRMLACEMIRLIGDSGAVILAHLHNAMCWNYSAGMPLTPTGYRNLFEGFSTRLFKESAVLGGLLNHQLVDLSVNYSDEELSHEPALTLITTELAGLFRAYECTSDAEQIPRALAVNPLYKVERYEDSQFLKLQFPSPAYEMEFADCKLYLPERVELKDGELESLRTRGLNSELKGLAERYVLLDPPEDYL